MAMQKAILSSSNDEKLHEMRLAGPWTDLPLPDNIATAIERKLEAEKQNGRQLTTIGSQQPTTSDC
jgi:hypothetical protein